MKCRKNTERKIRKFGRIMLLSKYAACDSKKSKFIKQQEAGGLLRSFGIKAPLNKIPFLDHVLFKSIK